MGTELLPESPSTDPRKVRLNVFVSYSRDDVTFADQLVAALTAFGFSTTIDREGIQAAENWKTRLQQLILESDTVVLVLTPNSVQSPMCEWEVEQALELKKRIVPIVASPLGALEPHKPLRDLYLNYIYFYPEPAIPGSGFGKGVALLNAALSVNLEWTREHTRLGGLASRWRAENQTADLLLRGSELDRAKHWRDARPPNAPELTTLQREFLQTSEDAEKARTDAEREQIEQRKRALEEAEKAQQERTVALGALSRRTRLGLALVSVLIVVLGLAGGLAYKQQSALQKQTQDLNSAVAGLKAERQRTLEAASQLEGARLRLREGMKLKIADTDHPVTTTDKWYRIATDYKLAIGVYRVPYFGAGETDIGTGFLVQGGGLHPDWAGRVVFITASHVIRAGGSGEPNLEQASIAFPGIDRTTRLKISEILYESKIAELDVAVLRLAGELPRYAVPVDLPGKVQSNEELGGIAVLHWTAADGFSLGFGHGLSKSEGGTQTPAGRMFYTHVTGGGASGAPVFDASTGNVACLHGGGNPRAPRPYGYCTSMSKIMAAIAAKPASRR